MALEPSLQQAYKVEMALKLGLGFCGPKWVKTGSKWARFTSLLCFAGPMYKSSVCYSEALGKGGPERYLRGVAFDALCERTNHCSRKPVASRSWAVQESDAWHCGTELLSQVIRDRVSKDTFFPIFDPLLVPRWPVCKAFWHPSRAYNKPKWAQTRLKPLVLASQVVWDQFRKSHVFC